MAAREPWSLWLAPRLYHWVLSAILATCRVRFLAHERVEALERQDRTWIFTSRHENTAVAVAL